jgi:hypothetical protein
MTPDKDIFDELPTQVTVPHVKVVDQKGAPASIDDYDSFMQFLMQASTNAQLSQIRKYFEDRTSKGKTQDLDLDVTDQLQRVDLLYKSQSIALINDGPNVCGVWLQHRDTFHPLGVTEHYEVNYETHKLDVLWVQCNPGETARLRATALS